MDVNGTRYQLLRGERDWLPLLANVGDEPLWWDRERDALSLRPIVDSIESIGSGRILNGADRPDAAIDNYGNLYWINATGNAVECSPEATPAESGAYWHLRQLAAAPKPVGEHGDFKTRVVSETWATPTLRGITVTARGFMLVGTLAPAGLLVFDLHGGGPPAWQHWPEEAGFAPFAMAPSPDGGAWILDRATDSSLAKLWRLDSYLNVVADIGNHTILECEPRNDFAATPQLGRLATGLELNGAGPVLAEDPVAIVALGNDSVVLLDDRLGPASTLQYLIGDRLIDSVPLTEAEIGSVFASGNLRGYDIAFVPGQSARPGRVEGSLYLMDVGGAQGFELALGADHDNLTVRSRPSFLPIRTYTGVGLVAGAEHVHYQSKLRWLPLTEQPRNRYASAAMVDAIRLDSKLPNCVWHRVIIDACIPPGASVRLRSRASNDVADLAAEPWTYEPDFYLRPAGAELPYYDPFEGQDVDRSRSGSWELLLQRAVGQHIEIQVEIVGNGRITPRILAMRIYYPRFSYLHRYLPDVYADDEISAGFLDRFLANTEGLLTRFEDRIAASQQLFDSRTAPDEFMEWIAGWLGASIEPSWDGERKRLFLDNAALLFRWRGTPLGLKAMIKLSVDECVDESIFDDLKAGRESPLAAFGGRDVRIVERFLSRDHPGVVIETSDDTVYLNRGAEDEPWSPQQGANVIHGRFADFLHERYGDRTLQVLDEEHGNPVAGLDEIRFPPLLPDNDAAKRDWLDFTRTCIGFTYAALSADDIEHYRQFLANRYQHIARLEETYGSVIGSGLESFDDVTMPESLPTNTTRLTDWIEFVSVVLPTIQSAHRFTVLLPTAPGELPSSLQARQAQVERIVSAEKPAHTNFEVKFFWALFQVGSARLGEDTSLGESSRFVAMVLGSNFLGQSYLAEAHPWNVFNRTVLGRDVPGSDHFRSA
jgi:phage tail-like protein